MKVSLTLKRSVSSERSSINEKFLMTLECIRPIKVLGWGKKFSASISGLCVNCWRLVDSLSSSKIKYKSVRV